MKRHLRPIGLLVCGLLLASAGCRRGPKPLAVKAAEEARQSAMGIAVIPNVDRSFERADAVAKALSLPFDKASQRKSFLDSLKAPEALANAIRMDGPAAIVAFAPKEKGKDPEVVVAATGKSPEALKAALSGLGQPLAVKDDAKSFKVGAETAWLMQRENLLIAATSIEALTLGAALAMESATAGEDDVMVRLYPEAIAKSQGTDVKTAITGYLATMTASLKGMPGQNPMVLSAIAGVFKSLGDRLTEVDNAGISIRIDAQKGASLRFEASPRKDSKLAGLLGKPMPYKLDTRVVPEGDALAIMAFSPMDMITSLWTDFRPLVAKDKAGEEAAKQIDVLIKGWTSGGSAAVSIVDKQMQIAGIYNVQKGVEPEAYLAATEGLMTGAWYKSLLSVGEMKTKITMKRDKDLLLINTDQEAPKNLPPAMADAMKGMGLMSQTIAMLVTQGNFFFVSGKHAAATAKQLPSAPARKPSGLIATAVEESAGADGFFYMDIGQFMKLGAAAMGAGENPMFSQMRLPLWLSYRGGKSAALDVRIPIDFVRAVGVFAPMLMRMGAVGGMGAPGPGGL